MPATTATSPAVLEELEREECLRLLETQSVGRLAVSEAGSAPHVVSDHRGYL